jgi:uncharacterized RDD family membrane protein YckC
MRKIDITTTQNVTIEYELATVSDRAVASIIDLVIIYFGSFILYGITGLFFNYSADAYLYIAIPGSFFYHLLLETLNHGQSLGKKIFKIRVVKITGERPGFFDFMMRTVFRPIDLTLSLGTLALIAASSSEKGQRLGDFFADTTVVKLANINRISLDNILQMDKLKSYTPSYPGVLIFKEEEMLLMKETLERCTKFPNESHEEALKMLIKKIEEKLNIVAPKNKVAFINTLIKDFVSLTR